MIKKIVNKDNSDLSDGMYQNVLINYILRGIAILLGLVSTSINLSYLGTTLFGQWATIASIASWINYGDLGIGNGFRNEFAKAVAADDKERQKKLIVSTAKLLGGLVVFLFILLLLVAEAIFKMGIMDPSLRVPIYITNFFFCLDLFFGIGRSAAYGLQKSWLTSFAQTTTVVLRILGVSAIKALPASLILFALVNGVAGLVGNLTLLSILKKKLALNFEKKLIKYVDDSLRKSIMGLGLKFFVLQLAGLVLYSSDNLIINKLITSEAVTKYELITKIYNTGENLFSILLISLWSAVTFALAKNDLAWIRKELKKLLAIWCIFSLGVVGVSIVFNMLIKIWLGQNAMDYEWWLVTLFAIYTIWGTFGSIFVNTANGIGRLKVQLIFSSIEAFINIPLSIFFAQNLGMGIFGVKLATLCCCIGANVFVPIDMILYLKKQGRSKGDH
ncbi:MAG: hypothetical protein HFG22_17320 [Lachnospiraceae bacterium]|nr:hypothetical protein [Lachnospiraceae bacterium]